MDEIVERLQKLKQEHILEQLPNVEDVSSPIIQQLLSLGIENACESFHKAITTTNTTKDYLPISNVASVSDPKLPELVTWKNIGIHAIRNNEVAAIILSGGQGTRLGYNGPKGMYNIGLPSNKSIFQLHIEKIMKIRSLYTINDNTPSIPIYIMTSDLNHNDIVNYFKAQNNFGYPVEDIIFFEQGLEPCFSNDGKIIVESKDKISVAPDGNGGIYRALERTGSINDMIRRNIKYLHVYGIDNVLTKSLDPAFIGACIVNDAEVGNKVVWRTDPSEKVGVTAVADGRMHIIEYSEIPVELASAIDSHSGKLLFGAANICNHFLTVKFLSEVVLPNLTASYHLASKKIPIFDPTTKTTVSPSKNNGYKLELFIFDVFPMASKWVVVQCTREDEFAPVKNAPGSNQDSPESACEMITNQGVKWLKKAGAIVENSAGSGVYSCEIDPMLSYEGEGLESFHGKTVVLPIYLKEK